MRIGTEKDEDGSIIAIYDEELSPLEEARESLDSWKLYMSDMQRQGHYARPSVKQRLDAELVKRASYLAQLQNRSE